MSGWDVTRERIERGEDRVTAGVYPERPSATGTGAIERHMTRCTRCTRLAKLSPRGLCAGCEHADPQRVVCAWCGTVTRDGREPASHALCEPCSRLYFIEDQGGVARECAIDAEAERVALCRRAGVTP